MTDDETRTKSTPIEGADGEPVSPDDLPEGAHIVDGEVRYAKAPPNIKRPWYFSPWLWAAVAGLITMPLLRPCTRRVPDAPPVVRQLPAWQLIDQDGKPFGSKDLAGHVYVVNFFFKSCQTVCPPLMRAMAELQTEIERLKVDVRLVSITVDPENDTPEQLREVAKKYGAKRGRWTLLTAKDPKLIRDLAVKGFLQHTEVGGKHAKHQKHAAKHQEHARPQKHAGSAAAAKAAPAGSARAKPSATPASAMAIAHSASMILVDHDNRIRGFYKRDKKWGIQEIAHRSVHVILQRRKK